MTIILERLALVLILLAIGVNFYFDNQAYQRDIKASKHLEEWSMGLTLRMAGMESKLDSMENATIKVAKATMYIDSCQSAKSTKVERAERRGKFVGGLLRGLFPGI
jgi:hypothetical protein